jgi:hypothetical protein
MKAGAFAVDEARPDGPISRALAGPGDTVVDEATARIEVTMSFS